MQVVYINGRGYLVERVNEGTLVNAIRIGNQAETIGVAEFGAWLKAQNTNELINVQFQNQEFQARDLTGVERGMLNTAQTLMTEAQAVAMGRLHNKTFDELLGKI